MKMQYNVGDTVWVPYIKPFAKPYELVQGEVLCVLPQLPDEQAPFYIVKIDNAHWPKYETVDSLRMTDDPRKGLPLWMSDDTIDNLLNAGDDFDDVNDLVERLDTENPDD